MIELDDALFGHDRMVLTAPLALSVARKEVVALVGPSGCGKTTILKTIASDLHLLGGQIRLAGSERDRTWTSRNLSRTLQSFPLFHWLTVGGNLRLASRLRGLRGVDIDRVLGEFSALHLKDKYPRTLSGGERSRASLSQAILSHPTILLLDEPFSGLDLQVKEEIADHLFSFAEAHDSSVLFVTHDIHDACEYAGRVAVLGRENGLTHLQAVVNPKQPDAVAVIRALLAHASRDVLRSAC